MNPDLDIVLASELGLEYGPVAYLVLYCLKSTGHLIVDEVDLVLARFLREESIRVGTYKKHVFGLRENSELYSCTLKRGLNHRKG